MSYAFVKGHGTENDFVIVPADVELTPARVRALCDRRAGIGGDGVIRAVRDEDGRWFMDYLNSDGSVSEMCGNGIRLYARYLRDHEGATFPLEIATRDGLKTLTVPEDGPDDCCNVDLGRARVPGETTVSVGERSWPAIHVDTGNPHAVAFVDDLADAGRLLEPPVHDEAVYPEGVNVEFVVRRGERHVGMRVHERGSGETRSCGTGAGAAAMATALADGGTRPAAYRVDVPGGTLTVTVTEDDRILLTGPAVIVATGTTDL
jgi:diaminopimelate epimerase